MGLDRREFLVVAAGGAGWMALNADGDDGDLIGGGGSAGNQPIDEPSDWLMVATDAAETLAAGESNEYYGIDWETDGTIVVEESATLTLKQ